MDAKTEARFKVLTVAVTAVAAVAAINTDYGSRKNVFTDVSQGVDSWINNDRIAVELSYKSVSTVVKELWDSCMGVKLPLP